MRDLSVYFCKKCGFYSYYPLAKYAVCPRCDLDMALLPIEYKEFINLNCYERDELLADQMIASSSSVVRRIIAPHKINNTRKDALSLSCCRIHTPCSPARQGNHGHGIPR